MLLAISIDLFFTVVCALVTTCVLTNEINTESALNMKTTYAVQDVFIQFNSNNTLDNDIICKCKLYYINCIFSNFDTLLHMFVCYY